MTKFTGKTKSRVLKFGAAALCVALAVSMCGNTMFANAYSVAGDKSDYYTSFGSKDDVIAAGNALNEEITEEGFVLMKNNNDSLPLATTVR